ncbi:hypothetical protein [Aureispira anguillae]|uniref:RiboL-PSP-HEPN domain-containing protein n=1 Tax=Aureispira anguillae TaxID=2864201 RepID=A0A915YD17_9BACT|nr:hypothetical protein [Aureispira anguillae]BDS10830.1 hypothetical protein AsAng_0015400 [Aureispira anguillae]
MAGRRVKDFHEYLTTATNKHTTLNDYLVSPATAFLKYAIEAKSAIDLCARKFPTNQDGNYSSDSLDSLQHLTVAILPSIMGHFETYQRILFGLMFDNSVHLNNFDVSKFLNKLSKETIVSVDIGRLAAYRNIGTASIGNVLSDSLSGWHNPERVNSYFAAFNLGYRLFSNDDCRRLKVLWQLRHSVVHTGGTITLPDAQKVDELKSYGRQTIAFEKNFIFEVARKLHPVVKKATEGIGTKYKTRLISGTKQVDIDRINKLFEVKSSVGAWLR